MNFRKPSEAWIVEPTIHKDERGYLAGTYDEKAFAEMGLNTRWVNQIQTLTRGCGVVRGMHWQEEPHAQIKLVRCVSGIVTDVIVDIRPDSPEFGKPLLCDLSSEDMRALYVPAGFAHGFQCISEFCIMEYLLSSPYIQSSERRFHCLDPEIAIPWPITVMKLSRKDDSATLLSHVTNISPYVPVL